MASPYSVVAARTVDPTVLLEMTWALRKALLARGERLPADWPEEAVADLRGGRLQGCFVRGPGDDRALGILSAGRKRAFGQLHVDAPTEPVELAGKGVHALLDLAPREVELVDIGVSGLSEAGEEALGGGLRGSPDIEPIRRFGLLRTLDIAAPPEEPALPAGFSFGLSRDVPLHELARLDFAAFQGGPDASLLAETPEGDEQLLEGIQQGQVGRFLEEASPVLRDAEGRVVGFAFCVERSARSGIIVDLALEQEVRGKGLGRALLERVLRALLALGHTEARLWVTEANEPARTLYTALGFRPEATGYIYRSRRHTGGGPSPQ